ncbi:MAG TPA: DNA-processing protein DprA [Solirubrobacteraceae bacterium]|jgi:DNA processing protein
MSETPHTRSAHDAADTMSAPSPQKACLGCLRRSWLLAMLSARLGYCARDRARLLALLALDDDQLIQAIAGRRRRELRERHTHFAPEQVRSSPGLETICRHRHGYPRGLLQARERAPSMLHVAGGGSGRLEELCAAPTVAIVGSRGATDYGIEMARGLARGLSASGVTVAGSLSDGVAVAAQEGALEAGGMMLTVLDGGLDVGFPARRRALHARLLGAGCVLAELPCGCRPRSWCYPARERIVAGLAQLVVVVEADDRPGELFGAGVAQALGRTVAAVPGRVTSPVSRGTHALLMDGAPLVRGPRDVLELLYTDDPSRGPRGAKESTIAASRRTALEPRLQATLERVGAGQDTAAKLTATSANPGETLLALGELELMGLLARGDGGHYVPRESLAGRYET